MNNALSIPSQMPQFPKIFLWNKASFQQASPEKRCNPFRISHIRFSSRNILHVPSIHDKQANFTVKTAFQNFVNWLPVDSGTLHGNIPALCFFYPQPKFLHPRMQSSKCSYLRIRFRVQLSTDQTGNNDVSMNVQSHCACQNVLHCNSSLIKITGRELPGWKSELCYSCSSLFCDATICCSLGQLVHVEQTGYAFAKVQTNLACTFSVANLSLLRILIFIFSCDSFS